MFNPYECPRSELQRKINEARARGDQEEAAYLVRAGFVRQFKNVKLPFKPGDLVEGNGTATVLAGMAPGVVERVFLHGGLWMLQVHQNDRSVRAPAQHFKEADH